MKHQGMPSTYTRIKPSCGSGFILKQIASFGPSTRKQVYQNTPYANYVDGYHCLLWKALLDDRMIHVMNGREVPVRRRCFGFGGYRKTTQVVSFSRNAPIYDLTEKGWAAFMEMMKRFSDKV